MNLENLISALIGGLLVVVGQILIEVLKSRKDKRSRIIHISSKAREIEQSLNYDVKALALFKTLVEYLWLCHNDKSSTDEYKKKYYDEHVRNIIEARKTERESPL